MNNKILATVISLSAVLSTSAAVAGGLPSAGEKRDIQGNDAYVTTDRGDVVRDISGDCVRTNYWTEALAIPSCEGNQRVAVKKISKPSTPVVRQPARKVDPEFVTVSLQAGALFDVNKSTLKSRGKEKLNLLAVKLKETITTETVQIVGHTDSSGSDNYNQRLSERRAIAVKQYLVIRGINGNKINTLGLGESKPIASNTNERGRARNRRVEVRIRATRQLN
ncbi:hypothetical protein MNBD_GAMMA12-339 [hydrothermal vent metagenome]|uniref:OmpA-like domain-containing protein n=1 Tax=hydrothermal vent metagenome TaxID=652676 RepID=A0A3B0Y3C4_9ZZZZ